MTTPAPPPQQQQQQQNPPPRQPPPPAPPAIPPQTLAAMALPLAGLLLTAASAAAVVATLKLRFKLGVLSALFWLAMLWVLQRIVMAHPPQQTGVTGHASEQVSRLNTARRAQFAIAATLRVARAMTEARARGEDVEAAGMAQAERERRYFQQHLDAMRQRAISAAQIDMQALEHGLLLGWKAILDNRTSEACRAANGGTFAVTDPPIIGFPGTVHPTCRCKAVKARPGAPSVNAKLAAAGLLRGAK